MVYAGENQDTLVPGTLIAELKSFAHNHEGATAVIEYNGRKGARILLQGGDGVGADQSASATDVARAACAEAGVEVENTWARDLDKSSLRDRAARHRIAG